MFCLFWYMKTYRYELKKYKNYSEKYKEILDIYIKEIETFLDKYKSFSDARKYLETMLNYYKLLAIKYRIFEGNLDKAIEFTEKCYNLAEELYKKFGYKDLKNAALFNKHIYYNLMARKYENERDFTNAAEYYKKSGDVIKEIDENIAYDEYTNYYKWLAIKNKYEKEKFEEYIDKAVEFAKKRNDEKQEYYYLGLKYDHLVKFADSLKKKIEYLKKAKEYYYKSGNRQDALFMEYLQYYYQSKYELKNRNYEKALDMLKHAKKALNKINELKVSNILISKIKQSITIDELLYNFYLYISKGNFDKSLEMLNEYLKLSSDWENTRKYKFYEYLKDCIIVLSQKNISKNIALESLQ
ncbi:protein of unknown function [Methanocaldococcus lauensis]|uniref:Uncharacterized protein n=2 Tax=Methanocaldococcus lauensis TaxID=2546128 RepID=A0A8D6PRW4_9EURY|nr:protein of unknown function [Methanocaldococcus lauensis]